MPSEARGCGIMHDAKLTNLAASVSEKRFSSAGGRGGGAVRRPLSGGCKAYHRYVTALVMYAALRIASAPRQRSTA